ncbi:hypothetical protein [Rhodoferax sp. WC2427]|uniref:hypothetical protein n=1 Tax=Rhodoferax sp. WC2427 TaxID=3234144 RepID=UPI0034667291
MSARTFPVLRLRRSLVAAAALAVLTGSGLVRAADDATLPVGPGTGTTPMGQAAIAGSGVAFRDLSGPGVHQANSGLPPVATEGLWNISKGLPADAQIRLSVSAAQAPADGRSTLRLAIELRDAQGALVTVPTRLRIQTTLGRLQPESGWASEGLEVVTTNGHAELLLVAPATPGDALLQVQSGAVGVQGQVSFVPDLRPLLVVGIVEGSLNFGRIQGDALTPHISNIGFEDSLHRWGGSDNTGSGDTTTVNGRAAAFVKGTIKGEYLLTAAFDSDKTTTEKLFRDIDPNQYYPIYGDASVVQHDAQSTSKLYVRIDKDKSYVLYGDFSTQDPAQRPRLASYTRALTGAKLHHETPGVRVNAFAAHSAQRQFVDEQAGRGISGPYAVSQPNAIANSETVELLTRDRNQPDVVLRRQPMSRYVDYDFEPFSGRILFRKPVPSADENFNPITIRITYEVDGGGEKFWVGGVDASVKLGEQVEVGGSYAEDRNTASPYTLYGAHADVQLAEQSLLTMEVARSEGNQFFSSTLQSSGVLPLTADPQGQATRIEWRSDSPGLKLRAHAARASTGFQNAESGLAAGRTDAGVEATWQWSDSLRLRGRALHIEDAFSQGHRNAASISADKRLNDMFSLELGASHVDETYDPTQPGIAQYGVGAVPGTGGSLTDTGFGFAGGGLLQSPLSPYALVGSGNQIAQRAYTSVKARLSARVTPDATVYGEAEQVVDGSDGRRVGIGAEYRLNDHSRVYGRHEWLESLSGLYGLSGFGDHATQTAIGVDTEYMKDGQVYSEYRMAGAQNGRDAAAAVGVRNLWRLGEGIHLTTGFERQQVVVADRTGSNPVLGSVQTAHAVVLGLDYLANPRWKAGGRLEYRVSDTQTNWLSTVAATRKLSDQWSMLVRNVLLASRARGDSAGDVTQDRFQLGLAYRDVATNVWHGLARYEHRIDNNTTPVQTVGTTASALGHSRTDVVSLHANIHPQRAWTLAAQVAAKQVNETFSGVNSRFSAGLLAGRVLWDVSERWDMGLMASTTQGGGTRLHGMGAEAGYRLMDNLWVSAGYVVGRYADADLFASNASWRGAYVRLRFKFDEKLLDGDKPRTNRLLEPANQAPREWRE